MNNTPKQNPYYLYILHSQKINKFYIGVTNDLNRRLYQHNNNLSPYTKNKGPWILVYYEVFNNKKDALKREKEIKNWKSREK
ncbi:MAG: GIY-YIG nuclease family protein, partial [Candidatus Woesearchaeota archaeon]